MKNRIPKPQKHDTSLIKRQHLNYTPSAITFSFEALDQTEYFNLDGTCINWASELFNMMKHISSIKKEALLSGAYTKSKYRVHSHENAKPPSSLPEGVELKDCYQIRISKSKGGIHGVFYDNIFYVIWLDPLHNMYPDDRYGGLRKVKAGSTCCKDRDELLIKLQEENERLREENEYWEQEIDKLH